MPSEDLDLDVNKTGAQQASQKTVILVAALFSLVTLLAVGLTIYFLKAPSAPPSTTPATAEPAPPEKKEPEEPPIYVDIKPPFLLNYVTKPRIRYLQIEVSIMVKGKQAEGDMVKGQFPLIKNNLVNTFSSFSFDDLLLPDGREKMRAKATEEVKKIMEEQTGKNMVENVLFTSFVIQ